MNRKIIRFFSNFTSYVSSKKDLINKYLSIFLATYFLLIFLPYIVARISVLDNFFMGSITKLIYRGITTIYFCSYLGIAAIANKIRVQLKFVLPCILLILMYVISMIISPKEYSYSIIGLSTRVDFYTVRIGAYSYITYFFSFVADCVVFIFTISFIPFILKNKRQLYLTMLVLISIMLLAVVYSLLKENDKIISLLKGNSEYDYKVKSLFHSKNAFGLYLFVASIACTFMLFSLKRKLRYLFLVAQLIFSMMSILAMCKSAFICCLFLLLSNYILFVIFSKGKRLIVMIVVSATLIMFMIFNIIICCVPALSTGFLNRYAIFLANIFNKIFNGIFTRTGRWEMCKYALQGPFLFIGMNDTDSIYVLDTMSQLSQNLSFTEYHNAYVAWLASHGIIGMIIYASFIGYLLYKMLLLFKMDKRKALLLFFILLPCLFMMLPESYTLFISIASYSFVINLILVCYLEYLTKDYKFKEKGRMNNEIE